MGSLQQELQQILTTHYNELWRLNLEIWTNPELAYKEFFAHDSICAYMEKLGYSVTRHAYGIETSFEVNVQIGEPKEDTGVIVYNAEYDALPGIGHACGHNLIATASIAGFILTAEVMKKHDIAGIVRLLGTPAEEGGGGKIDLIKCGAYKGVDACLMGHPAPTIVPGVQGVVSPLLIGACHGKITFHGFGAHAGNSPWLGKNALDAAVQAYSNIAMMRQQVEPDQRIHAIITNGGVKPNVIPELTEMQIMVRAEKFTKLLETRKKMDTCFQAAALATGCTVEIAWEDPYKELRNNDLICEKFADYAKAFGQTYLPLIPGGSSGASTDQGNVSYEVPQIHPVFGIDVASPDIGNHHAGFTEAGGTRDSFDKTLDFAAILAATGIDIAKDAELRSKIHESHKAMLEALLG